MTAGDESTGSGWRPSGRAVTDMDALSEGLSRAIVQGLVSKESHGEQERPLPSESALADTGLIAPLGDMVTERAVSAVGSLIDAEEISAAILRVAREKIEEVLNEDLALSRKGSGGMIAERVHLECARLFGRESFRKELMRLLGQDLDRTIVPALKREVSEDLRRVMGEVTDLVLDRVAEVLNRGRGGQAEGPTVSQGAAPDWEGRAEEIRREVLTDVRSEMARISEAFSQQLAGARPLVEGRQPGGYPARPQRARGDPSAAERIRDRLRAEGLL